MKRGQVCHRRSLQEQGGRLEGHHLHFPPEASPHREVSHNRLDQEADEYNGLQKALERLVLRTKGLPLGSWAEVEVDEMVVEVETKIVQSVNSFLQTGTILSGLNFSWGVQEVVCVIEWTSYSI